MFFNTFIKLSQETQRYFPTNIYLGKCRHTSEFWTIKIYSPRIGNHVSEIHQQNGSVKVIPFVHAAPGGARRRHERKELRVREVIDLRSLFCHHHYSCFPQNNRVTVRIHTMAAARWPLIPSKNPLSTSLLFSLNHMLLCKLWASYYGTCVLCSLVSLRQNNRVTVRIHTMAAARWPLIGTHYRLS